jgi:hypothetical protein
MIPAKPIGDLKNSRRNIGAPLLCKVGMRHINPMLTLDLKQLRRVAFKSRPALVVIAFVLFVRNAEAAQ